jgi:hypothetical protein
LVSWSPLTLQLLKAITAARPAPISKYFFINSFN